MVEPKIICFDNKMGRLEEFIKSCHTPAGKFQFRTLPELTAFVIKQSRILYPFTIHYSFGYFNMEYLIDDPEDKEIADIIRDSDYQFQEVTDQYLKQLSNGEIRRQFLTDAGDEQFFFYDRQKEKLYLISQILN
jgi:hypothetical protein